MSSPGPSLGSLKSYDGNCNKNVTLKKIGVFVELSVLQFFHVDWRGALSLSWHEWLSSDVKAKNERFTATSSRCRQNLRYEDFKS